MASSHPIASDLQTLFQGTGLVPDPTVAPFSSIDWASYIADAVEAMKTATGRMFGVANTATARTFDPPRDANGILLLGEEAVSVSSVTVMGASKVADVDYYLGPENADVDGKPWRWIEFAYPFTDPRSFATRKSVVVTAVWGYSLTVPDDVFDGELKYAAYLAAPQVALNVSKGLVALQGGDESKKFAAGRDAGPLSSESGQWLATYQRVVASKMRVDLGL